MNPTLAKTLAIGLTALVLAGNGIAASAADAKDKAQAKAAQLAWLSTDPTLVAAVKAQNANPPAEAKAMTNDQWKTLTVLDPFVKSLSKNTLVDHLKAKKDDSMSELFVSAADGTKVAFFSKTTSWSHKGKDKHDLPMKGETWIGPVEVDQSSGVEQIQIALPVLDGGTAIGSVVIGLATTKLQ